MVGVSEPCPDLLWAKDGPRTPAQSRFISNAIPGPGSPQYGSWKFHGNL